MSDAAEINDTLLRRLDSYPVALPSDRGIEPALRALCDGSRKLRALLPSLDALQLAQMFESVLWLEEPIPIVPDTHFVSGQKAEHCLILAAAPEDTFYSMGGYLIKGRSRRKCINAICFSLGAKHGAHIQNSTELVFARYDEASLNARMTGVTNTYLKIPPWAMRHAPSSAGGWQDREEQFQNFLCATLVQLIEKQRPTDIFAPAALGDDPDRRCLFRAFLQIFEAGYFPDARFHAYEVFPEATTYLAIDTFLSSVENVYVRLTSWYEDLREVAERKRQLVKVCATQPLAEWDRAVEPVSSRNAILAGTGRSAERFWRLRLTFSPQ